MGGGGGNLRGGSSMGECGGGEVVRDATGAYDASPAGTTHGDWEETPGAWEVAWSTGRACMASEAGPTPASSPSSGGGPGGSAVPAGGGPEGGGGAKSKVNTAGSRASGMSNTGLDNTTQSPSSEAAGPAGSPPR